MITIVCSNRICGTKFRYDEARYPGAQQVQCPACKTLLPLKPPANKPEEEHMDDWFKMPPPVPPQQPNPPKSGDSDYDDWSPRPAAPVPPPPSYDDWQPRPPAPRPAPPPQMGTEAGWLVVHDVNTPSATFSLQLGRNAIGRLAQSTPQAVNVRIKTQDGYMSRHHCDIRVEHGPGGYLYWLSDGYFAGKKPSSNGTFLNGRGPIQPGDEHPLKDGDVIQAGRTNLVLKLPGSVADAFDAEYKVRQSDFFQTIIQ